MNCNVISPSEATTPPESMGIARQPDGNCETENVLMCLYDAVPPVAPSFWNEAMPAVNMLRQVRRDCPDLWTRSVLSAVILHLTDLAPDWEFSQDPGVRGLT